MTGDHIEKYTFNISGRRYTIKRSLLQKFPGTRMAMLNQNSEEYDAALQEFYFDRNPKIMQNVLDLYRTGELHIPQDMCGMSIRNELEFWCIPESMISECCWKAYSVHLKDKEVQKVIQSTFKDSQEIYYTKRLSLKNMIWLTMDDPGYSTLAKIWNVTYFIFIALAVVVFCLFNEPSFRIQIPRNTTNNQTVTYGDDGTTIGMLMHTLPNPYLYVIDSICLVFFTLEILIRFTVCPWKCKFFKNPLNILDVFLILVMWTVFILDRFPAASEDSSDVKRIETFLRLCFSLRIFRILHFAKRSKTLNILIMTFKSSAQELSYLMLGLAMAVLISATLVFTAEMVLMTHTFDSIHNALWWALITMTTVGYGDYVPKTVLGQVVGSLSAIAGLLILSLPIAIIAANFNTFLANLTARECRLQASGRDPERLNLIKNCRVNTKPVSSITHLELAHYDG